MRIDIVTIFPEYFGVLDVSLLGRAREDGILKVEVHDLRDFTHDRHRTVDDKPYGGGAGMVMKPEPWGEALDAILPATPALATPTAPTEVPGVAQGDSGEVDARSGATGGPIVIFPSPAGEVFTQAMARELSSAEHLVFGCGRYEGIDHRVFEFAATRASVRLVSLGDYVLNGGEVAVMAMIEAIGRLIPGVIGNPESLVEESHEDGLLEYPSYTKPAEWRGYEVPSVLTNGNHGAIAAWRRDAQFERTRRVRPDLLPPE
ncbi:tRNA (guanosine(37)-N1)-methyltransferase TrmD [Subtercola lobariae]|uniref:tRNA (guanine-N(1)-)-methyltransferase n=1 Tax=Subtercola lobariae TaxID=1588641 RepID=A0A917BDQ3_9MICO|nr:tRNA (guanosine(37)-N1)-methyltransferase TrmD [Subtercola lobariae]GGF38670.1 tRNA (guanine-N(1)-)-methyltransferase [Subtercola lobariae]